jgi:hypothetical protein
MTSLQESTPTVTLVANSSDTAPVGGSIAFVLKIETQKQTTSDFTVEFLMPFDVKSRVHICKVEICATGWNVPCVLPDKPVYSSRVKDSNMDRAVIHLGHLTNHAVLSTNKSASTITVCLYTTILTHIKNVKDAKMYVTAGVIVSGTKLWVGGKEVTVSVSPPVSIFPYILRFYILSSSGHPSFLGIITLTKIKT